MLGVQTRLNTVKFNTTFRVIFAGKGDIYLFDIDRLNRDPVVPRAGDR